MKRNFILLILILFSEVSFSQFSCIISGTTNKCNVNLYKNKKYIIDITTIDNDGDIVQTALSVGAYLCNKDTVSLTDVYYKYKLKFVRKGKQLIPIIGFPWMIKQIFYMDDLEYDEKLYSFVINPTKYFKILQESNSQQYNKLYLSEYINGDYSVSLKKPNFYICKLGSLILSEGKFSYKKNKLIFRDKDFGFSFCCIVNHDGICVNFLPFQNACLGLK